MVKPGASSLQLSLKAYFYYVFLAFTNSSMNLACCVHRNVCQVEMLKIFELILNLLTTHKERLIAPAPLQQPLDP